MGGVLEIEQLRPNKAGAGTVQKIEQSRPDKAGTRAVLEIARPRPNKAGDPALASRYSVHGRGREYKVHQAPASPSQARYRFDVGLRLDKQPGVVSDLSEEALGGSLAGHRVPALKLRFNGRSGEGDWDCTESEGEQAVDAERRSQAKAGSDGVGREPAQGGSREAAGAGPKAPQESKEKAAGAGRRKKKRKAKRGGHKHRSKQHRGKQQAGKGPGATGSLPNQSRGGPMSKPASSGSPQLSAPRAQRHPSMQRHNPLPCALPRVRLSLERR